MYPQPYPVGTGNMNSLPFQTLPRFSPESSDYTIVAQDAIEAQDIQKSPAVSMWAFLMACGETNMIPTISVYMRLGYNRKHARLLYMNPAALRVWKTMGMSPKQVGNQHRPPHSAVLVFGTPFRD